MSIGHQVARLSCEPASRRVVDVDRVGQDAGRRQRPPPAGRLLGNTELKLSGVKVLIRPKRHIPQAQPAGRGRPTRSARQRVAPGGQREGRSGTTVRVEALAGALHARLPR